MFGCTGTIGEIFPYEKIDKQIPNLIEIRLNIHKINLFG